MTGALSAWSSEISQYAREVDLLFVSLVALVTLLSAPVFVLITIFAVKYRRGKAANRKHPINRNVWIETSWAIVPFLLIVCIYVWATYLFVEMQEPPPGGLELNVVAKQWMWKVEHPGGQREINALHVPAGETVHLLMTSQDVIHSFFLPALRLKQDVLPGRYTRLWFRADEPGTYRLTCAEFCGTDHSVMGGDLVVMSPGNYARWLEESDVDRSLAQQGAALFREQGCSGCHGPAATVHAPPLEGLYGRKIPLASGEVVNADSQYIRDSILLPQSQIAAGYPRIMPTFQNVLSEDEVLKLVAYIKSLRTSDPGAPR